MQIKSYGLLACLCLCFISVKVQAQVYLYGPTPKSLVSLLKAQDEIAWQQLKPFSTKLPQPSNQARILLVFGSKALASAHILSQQADFTVISYINQVQYQQQSHQIERLKNASVYFRNAPYQRQLLLLKLLLPQHKRIGVLCSVNSCSDIMPLKPYAKSLGLELIIQAVDKSSLGSKLNLLLNQSDSLLALEDRAIYNSNSIGNILLSSYRRNKPIIGLSPGYVKAGTLATSYSTKIQYQKRLLGLLKQLLKPTPRPKDYYFCQDFELRINHRVAHSMDLLLPLESAVSPLIYAQAPYEIR